LGWAGVNLFFVLSGFLITSILIDARDKPHYFRNFYGRRALRIWPLYVLLLVVVYLNADWFVGLRCCKQSDRSLAGLHLLCAESFHITMPPAIGQTWSLAIEEQYYFLWAPLVRFLRYPWMLAALLLAAFASSALFDHHPWLTPTHTLIHLDGIAMGSLLTLGIYTLRSAGVFALDWP